MFMGKIGIEIDIGHRNTHTPKALFQKTKGWAEERAPTQGTPKPNNPNAEGVVSFVPDPDYTTGVQTHATSGDA